MTPKTRASWSKGHSVLGRRGNQICRDQSTPETLCFRSSELPGFVETFKEGSVSESQRQVRNKNRTQCQIISINCRRNPTGGPRMAQKISTLGTSREHRFS